MALAPFGSPYRQADRVTPENPLQGAPLDWRRTAWGAVALTLGLVGAPAGIAHLAHEAHAVVPELFVGLAVVAGGAIAALFVSVLWWERGAAPATLRLSRGSQSGTKLRPHPRS
jgi:hypothetical protein